jgi:hypothetical protein
LLAFHKQGSAFNPDHLKHQLARWGVNGDTVDQIAKGYWNALNRIDARFSLDGITHVAPRRFLPFAELIGKLGEIKCEVGKVVGKIQEEAGKVA